MIKKITKVGNSHAIIFDTTLMNMAHLKPGAELNLEVHDGGAITLTPLGRRIEPDQASATATRLIRKNAELFRRLA